MIRFSAVLDAVAIGVLIAGGVTSKLALVYLAIVVGAAALVFLAIGVLLNREEIFGNRPRLAPASAGASPAVPASAAEQDWPGAAAAVAPVVRETAPAGRETASAAREAAPAGGETGQPTAAALPTVPHPVRPPDASTDQFTAGAAAGQQHSADIPSAAPREQPTRAEPRPTAADGPLLPAWARTAPETDAPPGVDPAQTTVPADNGPADQGVVTGEPDPVASLPGWFSWPGQPATLSTTAAVPGEPSAFDEPAAVTPGESLASDQPSAVVSGAATVETATMPAATEADDPAAAVSADSETLPDRDKPEAVPAVPAVLASGEPLADDPAPADDEPSPGTGTAAPASADPAAPSAPETDSDSTTADTASEEDTATATATGHVAVIRGVPRYHQPECVLIRFMPDDDLTRMSISEAKAAGCSPCTACQPPE